MESMGKGSIMKLWAMRENEGRKALRELKQIKDVWNQKVLNHLKKEFIENRKRK